jgi:predicted ATP-dependent serine protease
VRCVVTSAPPPTLTPLSTPLPLPSSRAAIVASKTRMRITTGSKELDRILGGGLETGR